MERYLRNGHGLDLSTEDIADFMFDSLDDYAHRRFERVRKPYPYLFSHFNRDLRARYIPVNYKEQLNDEYESVQQGDERLFSDYLTELRDYEAMLEDTSIREKYRILKKGLNDDLRRSMIVFEGVPYDDFVAHVTRIDPVLLKKRKERSKKSPTSSSSTARKDKRSGNAQSNAQSTPSRRFRPSNSSRRAVPARKPAVKELRPEISRQGADRRGLCRHCKEARSFAS